jgi:pimeloyl-ACP methyl ester carboxylesterase
MRFQFTAARREPIRVDIERLQETDLWHVDEHRIHYTEKEVLVVYFFRPKAGKPPFQSVLFGPPGNSVRPGLDNRQAVSQVQFFDYILQGGRAVVLPIWTGTYERVASITDRAERHRIGALGWHRDVVDVVNYLETLPDFSTEKLAYMAISYGASVYGQLLMAMEGRIKTGLFLSGGLIHTTVMNPILDSINYVPRITQPMLMLNGRYDHMYPFERSAQRMFDLLGTPSEHKKLVGFDSGHMFPRNQGLEEVSNWLDEYLGPVN